MKINVLPAILEYTEDSLLKKIYEAAQISSHLHIDIVDEKFSSNSTLPNPNIFKQVSAKLELELHMMVNDPIRLVKAYSDAGFKRFIGHIEYMPSQGMFLKEVSSYHKTAALAIDLPTPAEKLTHHSDHLLIMTVKAGVSGQPFAEEALVKITQVKSRQPRTEIEVDGGINQTTLNKTKTEGATRFAVTSAIFSHPSPETRLSEWKALQQLAS